MSEGQLTYRDSGVDIDQSTQALRSVTAAIRKTHGDRVLGDPGGFGALFSAAFPEVERPVLVSSIDGVGTKTKIAAMVGQFEGLGRDLVNHCINDILCHGAKPLFFLDYFGCSRLTPTVFEDIVRGAADACYEAGCALIGGETAEMPGVYLDDEIDLVGCIIGLVDDSRKLPRGVPAPGDRLIGLASDGLHTNGYSLARRALFEMGGRSIRDTPSMLDRTIGEELLRPHRSYFNAVYPLFQDDGIIAVAHITGGGLHDNLPRVLPHDLQAVVERRSWTPQPIFNLIREAGNVPDHEMYRAFNMGIGMVLVVSRDAVPSVLQRLADSGEPAIVIGELQKGVRDVQIV